MCKDQTEENLATYVRGRDLPLVVPRNVFLDPHARQPWPGEGAIKTIQDAKERTSSLTWAIHEPPDVYQNGLDNSQTR